jgi:hypothetical protein
MPAGIAVTGCRFGPAVAEVVAMMPGCFRLFRWAAAAVERTGVRVFNAASAGRPHPSCWSSKRSALQLWGHQGDIRVAGSAPCCSRRKDFVAKVLHGSAHRPECCRAWL